MIDFMAEFRAAVEAEMAKRARESLWREFHYSWKALDGGHALVLCDGKGMYTSESFEPEDQVLPLTPYAEHIMCDTIGELGRRPWYIEPPPCKRCGMVPE